MENNYASQLALNMIVKIRSELKDIEGMSSILQVREKVNELLELIDSETADNREILEELIFQKVKETNGIKPDLHTKLYILYRNLTQNKISIHEATRLYGIYKKEL